jgi:hypothetical protein
MRAWLKHKFTSDDIQNGGSWHNISYHLGGLAQADSWPQVGGGWINAPKSSLGFVKNRAIKCIFSSVHMTKASLLQSPSGLTFQ